MFFGCIRRQILEAFVALHKHARLVDLAHQLLILSLTALYLVVAGLLGAGFDAGGQGVLFVLFLQGANLSLHLEHGVVSGAD